MPLSIFRGRPLGEQITHMLDGAGCVVASKVVREAAWLPSDRWLVLALDEYERGLCPGCGQPKLRAWHPDMEGWYEPVTFVCAACQARTGSKETAPHVYIGVADTRPKDQPLHAVPGG